MDKHIFMVVLFSFIVGLFVIVLLTCLWKLLKLFTEIKAVQQKDDLEGMYHKNLAVSTATLMNQKRSPQEMCICTCHQKKQEIYDLEILI